MRMLAATIALLLLAGSAQGILLTYETSGDPERVVVEGTKFKRDENGDRMMTEDGRFIREDQFITVKFSASTEDCLHPPEGKKFGISPDGPKWDITVDGEKSVLIDLEPREFAAEWQQAETGGPWTAEGQFQVKIINEAKPPQTIEAEYHWRYDNQVADAQPTGCEFDEDGESFVAKGHYVLIPGDDFGDVSENYTEDYEGIPGAPTSSTGGEEGGLGIPGPGPFAMLGAVLVGLLGRRRVA